MRDGGLGGGGTIGIPAAAESFDQEHGGDHALIEELCLREFIVEEGAVGIDDGEIRNQAAAIFQIREPEIFTRGVDGEVLGTGFVGSQMQIGEGVLDILKGGKDLLAIGSEELIELLLGLFEAGGEFAAFKKRNGDVGPELPETALPVEQVLQIKTFKTGGGGEGKDGVKIGGRNADIRARGDEVLFGFGNIGTAAQQFHREARRDDRGFRVQRMDLQRESGGQLSEKHGNGVLRVRSLPPHVDFLCDRGIEKGFRLPDIQGADEARALLGPHERELLTIRLHGLLEDFVLCIKGPEIEIILRDVRFQREQHDLKIIRRRL